MNPLLGVFYHWLGGFASGSFYVPYRFVKKWSWEVYWLAGGIFSWILAPWLFAFFCTKDLFPVLAEALSRYPGDMGLAFLFGMMWGMGGLTFGLTMRYLGMSLGMAVALGYCTVFGAVMPPIVKGTFGSEVLGTTSGVVILLGVGVCVLGIVTAAFAGMSKEREMSEDAKRAAIKEFSFVKGLLVATFSGIMSAGMAYGMAAAAPLAEISLEHGTHKMLSEVPRLCIILAGGFTSNFIWCMILITKNKTGYQFFAKHIKDEEAHVDSRELENATDAPGEEVAKQAAFSGKAFTEKDRVPMIANYIFCAMAGVCWYLQFFFYSIGETQMGVYQFASWPLHMASIMIFSSLWGIMLLEWKGSSGYTKAVLGLTLATLIFSTVVMGYGTNIGKVTKENEILRIAELIVVEKGNPEARDKIVAQAGMIARYEFDKKMERNRIQGLARELGLSDKDTTPKDKNIKAAVEKIAGQLEEKEVDIDAVAATVGELAELIRSK